MIAILLSYTTYQQQKGGVCLPFIIGADDRTRFAFSPGNGRKLWSGSVKPSPAALVRAAFKWVRVLITYQTKRGGFCLLFLFGTGVHNVLGIKAPARMRIFNPYRRDIFVSIKRNEVLS